MTFRKKWKTSASIAESPAMADFVIKNVNERISQITPTEMKSNYTIHNGENYKDQTVFIVANYHEQNYVSIYGFKYKPIRYSHDIGMWKIKKLKIT